MNKLTIPKSSNKLTNPSGTLKYTVGNDYDFICFDFYVDRIKSRVLLHAVVNSETGHFIQNFRKPVWVSYAKDLRAPYDAAWNLVGEAIRWCMDNNVEHDGKSWNQDPNYFARAVHAAVTKCQLGPIRFAVKMADTSLRPGWAL